MDKKLCDLTLCFADGSTLELNHGDRITPFSVTSERDSQFFFLEEDASHGFGYFLIQNLTGCDFFLVGCEQQRNVYYSTHSIVKIVE